MPANDSSALIVARFLKSNNYTQSYEAFVNEAGLPEDVGDVSATTLTLERLLEEKRLFDQSVNFEKLSLSDEVEGWAPGAPTTAAVVEALPSRANLLHVTIDNSDKVQLVASTSDRKISIIDLPALTLSSSWSDIQDAPVLSQLIVRGSYHISSSMSGSLVVADLKSGRVIDKRKDHAKYIVGLALYDQSDTAFIASAGWDNVVHLYRLNLEDGLLGAPLAKISLPTKPESILFTTRPGDQQPVLVVTRTDSSNLYFYSVQEEAVLLGKQNLAPHSNAWVAFTPTSIALCPIDNTTIAVATNSTPHMKLIVTKLLIPNAQQEPRVAPQTPFQEASAQQAIADQEHEAIKLHCNTMSAQTPYSTPLVVWRPNGKGVWVNSDDGTIRGIDILSGKVVSELRKHDNGAKVRTLWAGNVTEDGETSERLVSGGFDHKLILWKPL